MAARQQNTKNKTKNNGGRNNTYSNKKEIENDDFEGFSKELIIWVTLLVSVLLLLCVFRLCGPLSNIFGTFLFGLFGFLAYFFPFVLFFSVGFYFMNISNKRVIHRIVGTWMLFVVVSALFQHFVSEQSVSIFKCYIQGYKTRSGGGFIGGCISMGFSALTGRLATTIILIAFAMMLIVFITGKMVASMLVDKSAVKYNEFVTEQQEMRRQRKVEQKKERHKTMYTFPKEDNKSKVKSEVILEDDSTVLDKSGSVNESDTEDSSDIPIYQQEIMDKFGNTNDVSDDSLKRLIARAISNDNANIECDNNDIEFDNSYVDSIIGSNDDSIEINDEIYESIAEKDQCNSIFESDTDDIPENITESIEKKPEVTEPIQKETVSTEQIQKEPASTEVIRKPELTKTVDDSSDEVSIEIPPEPIPYVFPSLSLLSKPSKSGAGMSERELKDMAHRLQDCLKSFKVDVKMTDIICGPTVTRYELQPALGTRVKKITELENDIKLNLAAADIRIEAPIPGKSAVGIEVPNHDNVMITLREMLETKEFQEHKSNVAVTVGKDIGGRNIVTDIAKMPHLLIAGATGSGKSVCINTIVMSIIYKADPNDVKLIMIDPKVVELSVYNGIPHLCIPVVTDPKKAAAALNWAVAEMNDRYSKFAELGVRDMKGFNDKVSRMRENPEMYRKMPQIVIIVDELADLMMVASHDVETAICRLAQMARAAGLHLIIATQRPSVDVITGLIKANVPSRIAFAVSSAVDSRTILDGSGAEKLLGKGDMLFFPQGLPKPIRVQGAFVSDTEVAKVTDFIKEQYDKPVYDSSISDKISNAEIDDSSSGSVGSATDYDNNGRDVRFDEAGRFIIEKQKASIGMLQRVFKLGFNRAARIMDQLCEAGVVSEEDGKKPRNILMTFEEFEQMVREGR